MTHWLLSSQNDDVRYVSELFKSNKSGIGDKWTKASGSQVKPSLKYGTLKLTLDLSKDPISSKLVENSKTILNSQTWTNSSSVYETKTF